MITGARNPTYRPSPSQRAALGIFLAGVSILLLAGAAGWPLSMPWPWFAVGAVTFVAALYYVIDSYGRLPAGVRTEGTAFSSNQARGWVAWVLGVLLTVWLVLIFASFGYRAPQNIVVIGIIILAAALISGALYLILDMDVPFSGPIQVSPAPLQRAIAEMQQ